MAGARALHLSRLEPLADAKHVRPRARRQAVAATARPERGAARANGNGHDAPVSSPTRSLGSPLCRRVLGPAIVALTLLAPSVAGAATPAKVTVWNLTSRFISKADAIAGLPAGKVAQEGPTGLRVRVILPADYSTRPCWPVAYLLHGTGLTNPYTTEPSRSTLLAAPFISIAPGGGPSWWVNQFNEGRRSPQWERWFADELIPTVERRLHVCAGRDQHTIAGLSMGGYGAMLLGAELPQYFATAGTFSGQPAILRSEFIGGYSPYAQMWGPGDGQYAAGKNPSTLVANLRDTRLFVDTGDGTALPGEESFLADPTTRLGEIEGRLQADDFVRAARDAAVKQVTYSLHRGLHSYIDFQLGLENMIKWGLFGGSNEVPTAWTYRTISTTGEVWGYRFRFAHPPSLVAELALRNRVLTVQGRGTVKITPPHGRAVTGHAPFALREGRTVHIADHLPDVRLGAANEANLTVTPSKPRPKQAIHISFRVPLSPTKRYFEVYANANAKGCSVLRAQQGVQKADSRTVKVVLTPRSSGRHPKRTWCKGVALTISVVKGKLGPDGQPTLGAFVGRAFVKVAKR